MKIVVCYKCVPYDESIKRNSDGTLNLKDVTWEIGQYDLNAVELGVQLAAATGGAAVGLTANGEVVSNSKMKKGILSRGLSEMFGVQDESLAGADSYATASVVKAAVEKIGDVDLVICGEGSGDMYAQQMGNIVGGLLGWNTVNGVCAAVSEDGALGLERSVDDGVEVLNVVLPAVISVTGDINKPRIPTMKDILGAGKKPATVWSLEDIATQAACGAETLSVLAPAETERKKQILDASAEGALDEFASIIKKALI